MSPIKASDMLKTLLNTDTIRRVPVKRTTTLYTNFLHCPLFNIPTKKCHNCCVGDVIGEVHSIPVQLQAHELIQVLGLT